MQQLDVLLALCGANVGGEMMQRLSQINPLAALHQNSLLH